ncbi:glycosyltransferase family 61 protein [Capillimicrobium parvum]|uniref:Glycosyltransferase 61 catalytic domain-containing protein n=1 Tax=Capillimicrobium parvum TaxID=2884022 RepID=A0A9E6Y262_9ACTN|nr:glycosyltransferase family 61 protein [Capillimicrobium parvum]UGS38814.1 hypothetical protein DSM104329_05244 [Capillimicrobium parvum]
MADIDAYEDYQQVDRIADLMGPGNRIFEMTAEAPPPTPAFDFLNGPPPMKLGLSRWPIQLRVVKVDNALVMPRRTIVNASNGKLLLDSLRKPLGPGQPLPESMQRRVTSRRIGSILRSPNTEHVAGPAFSAIARNDGYGHVLLEAVSQLWAAAELDLSSMPVAVNALGGGRDYQLRLMRPFGVTERNAVMANRGNVFFESLIVAAQSYVLPKRISQRFWDVTQRISGFYASDLDARQPDRRLYVSRRKASKRRLVDEERIEQIFARHDFEVFHPEDHDVPEQIRTFARASWIAGSVGSGLYNSVFAPPGVRRIILAPGHFHTPNDLLMSRDHGPMYLFGESSSTNPKQAIVEDWSIDAGVVERALDGVFAGERVLAGAIAA